MANNIKGITIEIGGDTSPLNKALEGVNKTAGNLQSELNQVNRQLKFDPKNVDLLRQKEELTSQATQSLKEKQDILKKAVEQAHQQFEKGDLGADKVRAVEREYAKVSSQVKDLEKDADSTSIFSKITNKLNITKENIKSAIGTISMAVGGFLVSSVKDAAEAGNAEANLEQTIKSTGKAAGMTAKQMEELAEKQMQASTFSKDEIETGEAMLATFTNIGKNVFPQASQAVLDFAQKMGTDPKSAALTLGKALNDPATGLSKLTKAGVTFTAQQQEQIKAMEKAGNTAGAQKLMIAELNKEFGGQASAAADTFSGKQKQLTNQFKEVKESIGNALIPILTQLGGYLVKILAPIASFISQHPKVTAGILSVVAIVGTLIGGLSAVNSVLGVVGITLKATQLLMTGGIMLAIMAIVAAAALIITHWSQIKGFFVKLWTDIKNIFAGIGKFFENAWNNIKTAIVKKGAEILQENADRWNSIINFFKELPGKLLKHIENAWESMKQAIVKKGAEILQENANRWNSVLNFFGSLPGKFLDRVKNIGSSIKNGFADALSFVKNLPHEALQFGEDFINGFVDGIKNMIHKVGDAAKDVANKVKSFLHFSRPDEGPLAEYEQWPKDFIEGYAKGIKDNAYKIKDAVKGIASNISTGIKTNTSTVGVNSNSLAVDGSNGNLTVNFNGNYCFANKEMIDYFVEQATNSIALQSQRRD